jgi:hypothetical protein
MSPSEDDDADRHIMPGPPWVRPNWARGDTHRHAERGDSEPERTDDSFRPLPRRARPQYRDEERYEAPRIRTNGPDESYRESWPPTLEPVVMPPPPVEKSRLPGLGLIIKFGGAVFVAACAALVMMNAVHIPATGIVASVESGSQPDNSAVFGGLTEIASAQAKGLVTSEPPQAGNAYVATVVPNAVAVAQPSTVLPKTSSRETSSRETPSRETYSRDTPLRETSTKEASLEDAPVRQTPERGASLREATPRPDTVTRAAAPPEDRRVVSPMSRDEISSLLKRGQALIAAGDIASARLILTRLAEAGSVDACLALAGTFDAAELAELHVVGVQPDSAKARAWYLKAAEQGSSEAKRRLQQSSAR